MPTRHALTVLFGVAILVLAAVAVISIRSTQDRRTDEPPFADSAPTAAGLPEWRPPDSMPKPTEIAQIDDRHEPISRPDGDNEVDHIDLTARIEDLQLEIARLGEDLEREREMIKAAEGELLQGKYDTGDFEILEAGQEFESNDDDVAIQLRYLEDWTPVGLRLRVGEFPDFDEKRTALKKLKDELRSLQSEYRATIKSQGALERR